MFNVVLTTPLIVSKSDYPNRNRDSTIQDPDDVEFELIGIDEFTIRRLRKSSADERRERLDREIQELMKQSYGR